MKTVATSATNTSKQWSWMAILLMGILSLGIISCSDNSSSADSDSEVEEVESAFLYTYYNETPQGRVRYMDAAEEIPSEPDIAGSIELGIGAATYSVGDNTYTINPEAGTITKWKLNRETLEFSVDGLLSYASAAGGAFSFTTVFVSQTEAYLPNFSEGQMVEINPTEMEIVEVHNFDPVDNPLGPDAVYMRPSGGALIDGKPAWIIPARPRQCCDYDIPLDGATVAIWDPATKALQYNTDERSLSADRTWVFDENGRAYVQPNRYNGVMANYFNGFPSDKEDEFTLLRLNEDGSFDQNFSVDLAEFIPMKWYSRSPFILNNSIVFTYANDFEWADSYDDLFSFYGNDDFFKSVALDLETGEVTPFTSFDEYEATALAGNIDGTNYITGINDFYTTSVLLRQDGLDNYTVVMTHDGGAIGTVDKLW